MQKLLLLEDDISLVDGLTYSLEKNGFAVEVARTIKEAEKMLAMGGDFVLFLFDVTLPDGIGSIAGLPLNRLLFRILVTNRWGTVWVVPGKEFLIILLVMFCAVCLAVRGPARQIREMTVVDTIGAD